MAKNDDAFNLLYSKSSDISLCDDVMANGKDLYENKMLPTSDLKGNLLNKSLNKLSDPFYCTDDQNIIDKDILNLVNLKSRRSFRENGIFFGSKLIDRLSLDDFTERNSLLNKENICVSTNTAKPKIDTNEANKDFFDCNEGEGLSYCDTGGSKLSNDGNINVCEKTLRYSISANDALNDDSQTTYVANELMSVDALDCDKHDVVDSIVSQKELEHHVFVPRFGVNSDNDILCDDGLKDVAFSDKKEKVVCGEGLSKKEHNSDSGIDLDVVDAIDGQYEFFKDDVIVNDGDSFSGRSDWDYVFESLENQNIKKDQWDNFSEYSSQSYHTARDVIDPTDGDLDHVCQFKTSQYEDKSLKYVDSIIKTDVVLSVDKPDSFLKNPNTDINPNEHNANSSNLVADFFSYMGDKSRETISFVKNKAKNVSYDACSSIANKTKDFAYNALCATGRKTKDLSIKAYSKVYSVVENSDIIGSADKLVANAVKFDGIKKMRPIAESVSSVVRKKITDVFSAGSDKSETNQSKVTVKTKDTDSNKTESHNSNFSKIDSDNASDCNLDEDRVRDVSIEENNNTLHSSNATVLAKKISKHTIFDLMKCALVKCDVKFFKKSFIVLSENYVVSFFNKLKLHCNLMASKISKCLADYSNIEFFKSKAYGFLNDVYDQIEGYCHESEDLGQIMYNKLILVCGNLDCDNVDAVANNNAPSGNMIIQSIDKADKSDKEKSISKIAI